MIRSTSLYASLVAVASIVAACSSDSNESSTNDAGTAGATGGSESGGAGGGSGGAANAGNATGGNGGVQTGGSGGNAGAHAGGGSGGTQAGGGSGGTAQAGGGAGGNETGGADASAPDARAPEAGVSDASSDGSTGSDAGSSQMYTTTFPLTENPISEDGHWIDTGTVGIDWNDVSTTPGKAFGDPSTVAYSDPTAILAGTWGPTQTVTATVFCAHPTTSYYQEVEIRLRSSVAAHNLNGYEVNFRCLTDGNAYTQIVRWNGPLGNFTYLNSGSGSSYGVANGDTVSASIVGNLISVYRNGALVLTATDGTFTSGNPGIGFNYGVGASNVDFGFTSFTASAE